MENENLRILYNNKTVGFINDREVIIEIKLTAYKKRIAGNKIYFSDSNAIEYKCFILCYQDFVAANRRKNENNRFV